MLKKILKSFLMACSLLINAIASVTPAYCLIKKDSTYYCLHSYYSDPNITSIDTSIETKIPPLEELPRSLNQLPPIPQDSIDPSVAYKMEEEKDWPKFINKDHPFISYDTNIHSISLHIPKVLEQRFKQSIPTTYSRYFTHFLLNYLKHEPFLSIVLMNNFFSNGQQETRIRFVESCLENNIPLYINENRIDDFILLLQQINQYRNIQRKDDVIEILHNHIKKINQTRQTGSPLVAKNNQHQNTPDPTVNLVTTDNQNEAKNTSPRKKNNSSKSCIEQVQEYFKQKLPQFKKPIIYISAFILLVSIRAIFLYSFNLTQEPHS